MEAREENVALHCAEARIQRAVAHSVFGNDRSDRGARVEYARGEVPDFIARVHQIRAEASSPPCAREHCCSPGQVLTGRPAAMHRTAREDFREHGVRVSDARVVDDGDVITAGGVTSGLDLALHLVERFAGRDLADTIAARMEYRRPEAA